jgi:hypothetical protein
MTTYEDCPKCGEENVLELKWEHHRADDGEFYILQNAECASGCEFDADDMELFNNKFEVTMEDVNDFYEPDFTDFDKY